MNQKERDELSIFMMAQDGRITEHAGRANSAADRLNMVKRILGDTSLTAKGKVEKLKDKLGMNATKRALTPEMIEALRALQDTTENDFET